MRKPADMVWMREGEISDPGLQVDSYARYHMSASSGVQPHTPHPRKMPTSQLAPIYCVIILQLILSLLHS